MRSQNRKRVESLSEGFFSYNCILMVMVYHPPLHWKFEKERNNNALPTDQHYDNKKL